MVDASFIHKPLFTLYLLPQGEIAIRRTGSIMRVFPSKMRCEVGDDSLEQTTKLEKIALQKTQCYGIFGLIELVSGPYLILIDKASIIGQILECDVMRVESLMYIPVNNSAPPIKVPLQDQQFIDMLMQIEKQQAFYFSYDLDLTKRMQLQINEKLSQQSNGSDYNAISIPQLKNLFPNSFDNIAQFTFNHNILSELRDIQYAPFRVPCIYGYVDIKSIKLDTSVNPLTFALISRKDCRRPGRRFLVRGLDREGNAANFVESEHIFTIKQSGENKWINVSSHVQIRGSIPLQWSMKPNLKWSPPVIINPDTQSSVESAQRHFKETNEHYKQQVLINLIDKKGSQDRIGKKFTEIFQTLKDDKLTYEWFDFHHECKGLKFENLSKLLAILNEKLIGFGGFRAELAYGLNKPHTSQTCKVIEEQSGVMRTNCMDCLDRTNVVQSVFSRRIALIQLHSMKVGNLPQGLPFEPFSSQQLERTFRNTWTDNADIMSLLYAGTPALKTDFTRTGKRTIWGELNDGKVSITRYYINNFTDGYNHDCIDLWQKKLTPISNLNQRSMLSTMKMALIGAISILVISNYFLHRYFPYPTMDTVDPSFAVTSTELAWNHTKTKILHQLIYFGMICLSLLHVMSNGRNYVDEASRIL